MGDFNLVDPKALDLIQKSKFLTMPQKLEIGKAQYSCFLPNETGGNFDDLII